MRAWRSLQIAAAAAFLCAPFCVVEAATVHGTVKNGTTGKPAADTEVILIQLQGGMQPVLNSKTDAHGQFTFDYPSIGTQPMLVRAVYRGINFHQPLPPGRNDVEVEVFEPSRDPKTISVGTHFVIFQPKDTTLVVGEEYSITNNSQPAQAYFRPDGNFDFTLPEGASLKQVAAQGPSGMPVVQSPIDRGKDRYSVAYAFRPGENGVRFSYELPYAANAATVKLPTVYPGARLVVVAPPTVQITAEGLQSGGQEQGMSVYSRESLVAGSVLSVGVSGTAPPAASAGGDADGAGQGRDADQGSAPGSSVSVQTIPGRLDDLKWPLVGGFLCIFTVLAVMLARKPVAVVAGGPEEKNSKADAKVSGRSMPGQAASTAPSATSLAAVDAAIGTSLDSLKETLFRLELRRQAGTISEAEYNQERARAEKVLRDLVRG
jgi:hypothetical protein